MLAYFCPPLFKLTLACIPGLHIPVHDLACMTGWHMLRSVLCLLRASCFCWYTARDSLCSLQLVGLNVAPFTSGKAALLLAVLRKMEGQTADIHQHYRVSHISHSELSSTANVTLVIVRSKENSQQGLDQVQAFCSSLSPTCSLLLTLVSLLTYWLPRSLAHSLLAHSPTPSLIHSPTHPPTHSPTHPPTHSPTHPLTHSLTHSFAHPLTRSPAHPFTHPPTHPPMHPPTYPLTCALTHSLCNRCSYVAGCS